MSLNYLEIEKIVFELQKLVIPCKIEKISELYPSQFFFKLYNQQSYTLTASLRPKETRLHLTNSKISANKQPSAFLSYLRKYIQNGMIESIIPLNHDRIVELTIRNNHQGYYLIIEMIQKRENVLLLNSKRVILYTFNLSESAVIGDPYHIPESRPYQVKNIIPDNRDKLYNQVIDEYYTLLIEKEALKKEIDQFSSALKKGIKSHQKLLNHLIKQKEECAIWEKWEQQGELLKSHFHQIKRGEKQISLQNYFDPELSSIVITLDPTKEPAKNVEQYFKKAKKLKSGLIHVVKKLDVTTTTCQALMSLQNSFNLCQQDELNHFIVTHSDNPLIKKYLKKKLSKLRPKSPALPYRVFYTANYNPIYVGKSNKDNDRLTFSVAKGNDIWLHVRDYAGSHVILPLNKNEELIHENLLDAAHLALNYSKAKKHHEGEVIYTKRKFISKPKHSHPGEVQVSNFKVISIKLDPERFQKIKDRLAEKNERGQNS